jgi:hypothetical protein
MRVLRDLFRDYALPVHNRGKGRIAKALLQLADTIQFIADRRHFRLNRRNHIPIYGKNIFHGGSKRVGERTLAPGHPSKDCPEGFRAFSCMSIYWTSSARIYHLPASAFFKKM